MVGDNAASIQNRTEIRLNAELSQESIMFCIVLRSSASYWNILRKTRGWLSKFVLSGIGEWKEVNANSLNKKKVEQEVRTIHFGELIINGYRKLRVLCDDDNNIIIK